MKLRLKPYPEYKDSGVEWLGKIPAHWSGVPIRAFTKPKTVRGRADLPLLSVYREFGVIERDSRDDNYNRKGEDLANYKVVSSGDLVINKMKTWQGSLGVSEYEGIVSPAYIVCEVSSDCNRRYLHSLLRSRSYITRYNQLSFGVRVSQWDMRYQDFKQVPVFFPPIEEQDAVVRFIHYIDHRIDRLIRTKQRLIKLLNEQKQAIIHRAVTRGIDPKVRLKPCGVEWLHSTPAHWTWMPMKRLLSRMDYGTSEAAQPIGKIRILTMGNIQNGEVIVPESGGLDQIDEALLLEHHDLLFTRTNGNPELVGKVGIFRRQVSDRVSFASYLVRLRVKHPHDPLWFHMLVNSVVFWAFARSHALVNLQTNLNATRYSQFSVPVPPPTEQRQLVKWVEEEFLPIRNTITRSQHEIDLIREYRIRLISDVVTGKLDVRGVELTAIEEAEKLDEMENGDELEAEDPDETEEPAYADD